MGKRTGQLAGLAALGALGYMLSKDDKEGKKEAPVETRPFSPNRESSKTPAAEKASAPAAKKTTTTQRSVDEGDDRDVGGGFNPAGLRRNMETGEMYDPGTVPNRTPAASSRAASPARAATTPRSTPAETSAAPAARAASAASAPASAASAPSSMSAASRPDNRPDLSTPEGRRRAEQEQALEASHPELSFLPGGGIKGIAALAKSLANRTPRLAEMTMQALPAPTARLTGPSAASIKEAERAARAATRQAEMRSDNAARYGLDPNAPGMSALRDKIGGDGFVFRKKGGSVKAKPAVKKMASGGTTSGASKRADGIAQRGKTRGKMY
jgi:hypothetical protein